MLPLARHWRSKSWAGGIPLSSCPNLRTIPATSGRGRDVAEFPRRPAVVPGTTSFDGLDIMDGSVRQAW